MNDWTRAVFWISPVLIAVCSGMATTNLELATGDAFITSKTLPNHVVVKLPPRAQEQLSVKHTIPKRYLGFSEKKDAKAEQGIHNRSVMGDSHGVPLSPTGKVIKDSENLPNARIISAPTKEEVDVFKNSLQTLEEFLANCEVAGGEDAVLYLTNELKGHYAEVLGLLERIFTVEVKVKTAEGEKLGQKSSSMERPQLRSTRNSNQPSKQDCWQNREPVANSFANIPTGQWTEEPKVSKATQQDASTSKLESQKTGREMLCPVESKRAFKGGLSVILVKQRSSERKGKAHIAEDQENFHPVLGTLTPNHIKNSKSAKYENSSYGMHGTFSKSTLKASRLVQGLKRCLHRIQLLPLGEAEADFDKSMSVRVLFEKNVFQAIDFMYRFGLINQPQMLDFFLDGKTAKITGSHLTYISKIKESASSHQVDMDIDFFKEDWSTYHLRHCLIDFPNDIQIDVIHSAFSTFVNLIQLRQVNWLESSFQQSLSFFTRAEFPDELKALCNDAHFKKQDPPHSDMISLHMQKIVQSFILPELLANRIEHNINFQMLHFIWRYGPYSSKMISSFSFIGREFARRINVYSAFFYERLTIKQVELGKLLKLFQNQESKLIKSTFPAHQISIERSGVEEKIELLSQLATSLGDPKFELFKLESEKWLWLPDP